MSRCLCDVLNSQCDETRKFYSVVSCFISVNEFATSKTKLGYFIEELCNVNLTVKQKSMAEIET